MADGIDHRHDAQSEGKRDPEDPDAELRHAARQQRAPAAGEHNPKCADGFGHESISHNASSERVLLSRTMPVGSKKRKGEMLLDDVYCIIFLGLRVFLKANSGNASMRTQLYRCSLLAFTGGDQTKWRHSL